MAPRLMYRADNRPFNVNDPIPGDPSFLARQGEAGKLGEKLANDRRPGHLPERATSLMLFDNEKDALVWSTQKSNCWVYEIEIDDEGPFHRGDMNIFTDLSKRALAQEDVDDLVDAYWSGEASENPLWEYLTEPGVVTRILRTPAQRQDTVTEIATAEFQDESIEDVLPELFGPKDGEGGGRSSGQS